MHPHNLSTSSSSQGKRTTIYNAVATLMWYLCFLVLFDVAINVLFPYPSDPREVHPGSFNLYFEYGRSLEGKFARMIGPKEESTAIIARGGWLGNKSWTEQPVKPDQGSDLLVATYGMSFSRHASNAIKTIDPKITLRLISGPGAPPNHSFAAYNLERGKHQADVVIWGILASSVKGLSAMNSATWLFEGPVPFTYPKYYIKEEKLQSIWPKVKTREQFYAAMQDEQQWDEFVNQIRVHDPYFNSFLFEQNLLDASAVVRMIRRAWAQKYLKRITNQIHTSEGFNTESEEIAALSLMVADFAATAKSDGKLPIVLLLNDRGHDNSQSYEDHLFELLKPTLEEASIPFVNTYNIAPASDIRNFAADGHFTKAVDKLIAQQILELINENLDRSNSPTNLE